MEGHVGICTAPATRRIYFHGGMNATYCDDHTVWFEEKGLIDSCELLLPEAEQAVDQERYRAFLESTVEDPEYAAYLEHNSRPRVEDY